MAKRAGHAAEGTGRPRGATLAAPGQRTAARYLVRDLARAAGVTPRAIRFYVERGLLPAPAFRGTATAYGEEHLLRLRAIRHLREKERLRLDAIQRRLARLSPAEIAALLPAAPAAPFEGSGGAAPGAPPSAGETWRRIPLLPGLELHVRGDATPVIRRLAEEICTRYSAPPGSGPNGT